MKKLVILALVTALAAGVVFAQELDITGFYRVGADVVGSSSEKFADPTPSDPAATRADYFRAGATHSRGRLNFSVANDDGTFGGFIRVEGNFGSYGANHVFDMPYGYAWWQPIEQVKITAGLFDDFYVYDIVDTFGGVAEDTKVHHVINAESDLFVGPFAQHYDDGAGLGVGIYPIPGLSIGLGIPLYKYTVYPDQVAKFDETAKHVWGNVKVQVAYELEDTVRVALGFHAVDEDRQTGGGTWKDGYDATNSSIFLAGYITAIENMGINIGLQFTLPYENDITKTTYNAPFRIGLGFNYDMDAFGIGARLGFALGSSAEPEVGDKRSGPFEFGLNILPSYDLGVCKIFLNAGIHMIALNADYKKSIKDGGADEPKDGFGFHINPYVEKSIGGGSFFVGFKLYTEAFDMWVDGTDEKAVIRWSIPCGMRFAF
jgi:hypothetical protein